jgi:hypothetical protein
MSWPGCRSEPCARRLKRANCYPTIAVSSRARSMHHNAQPSDSTIMSVLFGNLTKLFRSYIYKLIWMLGIGQSKIIQIQFLHFGY